MACQVLTVHCRADADPSTCTKPTPNVICEAAKILAKASHGVLGTASSTGNPYAVPVTLALLEGDIYFHCAKREGHRTKNLRQNSRVSLCVIDHASVVPGAFNVDYQSLLVEGRAVEVTDLDKKRRFLKAFCLYRDPTLTDEAIEAYSRRFFDAATLWCIRAEHVSVKSTTPD